MNEATYVAGAQIKQLSGGISVSDSTLRSWANNGLVRCIKLPGGKRLYHLNDVISKFQGLPITSSIATSTTEDSQNIFVKQNYIYARVSSSKQKTSGDLARQVQALREAHPDHQVIQEVGSGLNYHRKGLTTLLERCLQGMVEEVVVSDRDRLARFGVELLEWILSKCQVRFVVQAHLGDQASLPKDEANATELAEDLLAICNYFTARNNGLRAGRNKRARSRLTADESAHDCIEAGQGPETSVEAMDGSSSLHLQRLCDVCAGASRQNQPEAHETNFRQC